MAVNKNIGLALGGGAILGAAHIGVLKAIEEYDIEISYVAGTSIGSLVGAFFAFGKNWDEILDLALKLDWLDVTEVGFSKYGLLSNKKVGKLIRNNIGDKNIEDSDLPLSIITTDISNGEKIVISEGNLADAVTASTCIPGIFIPQKIDGRILVDGGIVENVPINTLRKMGSEKIICSDLSLYHTSDNPKNIIDIILNTFHFTLMNAARLQTIHADVILQPDLSAFNLSDMEQINDLYEVGYEEAKEKLKTMKK